MKRIPIKFFCLILLFSMAISPAMAKAPEASTTESSLPEFETPTRPEPELVPQEIQDLFESGMSIEEFLAWNEGPIPNALMEFADMPLTVIVQLEEPSLITYMQQEEVTLDIQKAYVSQLTAAQGDVINQIKALGTDVTIMGSYTKVLNGFMARVPASELNAIRALPGVKSVTRAPKHEIDLSNSVPLTKSDLVWVLGDTGYTGKDITVAVIDTGIDYTHAMFGTLGDPDAYASNDPNIIEGSTFPTPKVIGGYDFAGTAYDADSDDPALTIPVPDEDPLDENGHGTHVSSTVAGIDAGFGSGVAPDALLYALKVFGAEGSTNLVVDAIEWAMDPNGDGYINDHVDVINMSLGSSFGPADENDPEYIAIEAANTMGVFVVASAGNVGNESYSTGSPGNTDSALAVAASTTGFQTAPFIAYNDGADKEIPYTTSGNPFTAAATAELVAVDTIDGDGTGQLCYTTGIADGALIGKIALIIRGGSTDTFSCTFSLKITNAQALGAIAAIIYNNTTGTISMATDGSTLPAGSILQSDGLILKGLAPINVTVGPDSNVTTFISPDPADTIADFSSRGPRGYDSMLKPEITAPGVAIFAANMGSGDQGVSMGGTSMAAPHIAGVAALMKQVHPSWSNEQIKAALMNTAVDLADPVSAEVPRQGAGRVDALAAVTTNVIAVGDSKLISLSWGLIEITEVSYESIKTVTLTNFSDSDVVLDVASIFTSPVSAGATLTPGVTTITIPAHNKAVVEFTLKLNPTQLPISFGNMEEYYGYVTFVGPGASLRVPFYFVPRPYTELTELDAVTSFNSQTGFGYVDLEQSGPVASSLWAYPVFMVSDEDPGVLDAADLRYVGLDYGWTSASYGDVFVPAFAMWDDQHANQPYWSEVDMVIYGDASAPVVDFNYNYGAAYASYPDNQWIVLQVDYNDGNLYMASPWLIYADYNSGFQEWYLPAAYQYVTDSFDYEVTSYDWYGTTDYAGTASFDVTRPPFTWNTLDATWTSSLDDPFNEPVSLLFEVNNLGGFLLSKPEGIMLVDYHGKPGIGQAYFWSLDVGGYPQLFLPIIMQ